MTEIDSTIPEFCARRNICRQSFYNMQAEGKAPRTYKAGRSKRITPQAEAEWLAEREAEAAEEAAKRARERLAALIGKQGAA